MNKYVIPICDLNENKVYNKTIMANSYNACEEKLMDEFSEYSTALDFHEFVKDLDNQDIIIGQIMDIEEL